MRPGKLVLLAALLAAASCGAIVACVEWATPSSALPDERYRQWWAELEHCTGLRSHRLEEIRWEIREHAEQAGDRIRVGHWDPANRIWLAKPWAYQAGPVKHEMLHFLLQDGHHPAPPFGTCTEGVI